MFEILGGLAIGLVAFSGDKFISAMVEAFQPRGAVEAKHSWPILLLAFLAFVGYLLNFFRQIHALGIAWNDPKRDLSTKSKLENFGEFLSSLTIILLPTILLTLFGSEPRNLIGQLSAPVLSRIPESTLVVAFYLITAIAYRLWDRSAICPPSSPTNGEFYYHSAANYGEYAHNWRFLAHVAIWVCVGSLCLVLPFLNSLEGGRVLAALVSLSLVPVLTLGFSAADYDINRQFYFSSGGGVTVRNGGWKRALDWRAFLAALILLVAIVAVLAYRSTPASPMIRLQLKWVFNAGFAGDLVAQDRGAKWGSSRLELLEGGIAVDPIKAVISGSADFGVATGDQLLLARSEGVPIVAVAVVYQDNPLAWITKVEGISSPQDLKGRRVGLTFIDDAPLFEAMLARAGVQPTEVETVPVKFDSSPFFTGAVDAFPVFRNTQGVEFQAKLLPEGIKPRFLAPSELGVVSYSNLYFCTERMLRENPKLVEDFLKLVIQGWEFAEANPDEAAKVVSKYDELTPRDIVLESVKATNLLVRPRPGVKIGEMSLAGWEQTQDVLLKGLVLRKRVDLVAAFAAEPLRNSRNE